MASPGITLEQRERIIELKLQRVPVRTIAEQVGVAVNTVQLAWKRYLTARADEFAKSTKPMLHGILAQLEQNGVDARRGYQRAMRGENPDLAAAARFLAAELAAQREFGRLAGLYVTRVEHTGADGEPIEIRDPKALLLAKLDELAQPED